MPTIWQTGMVYLFDINGFTESFYYDGALATAKSRIITLAEKRNLILVRPVVLREVIVRGVTTPGIVDGDPVANIVGGALPVTDLNDVHNVAAYVRYSTTKGYTARCWLHGMPDDWLLGNSVGAVNIIASARLLVQAYLAQVVALGFSLRGYDRDDVATGRKPILSITTVAGVTTLSAPGFDAGTAKKIIIQRCKGWRARQWNGLWRIVSGVPGTYVISNASGIDPTGNYIGNSGNVRKLIFDYDQITTAIYKRGGTRRLGRAPNV